MAGASKTLALARYTLLRLGLFAVVWLILELVTPLGTAWTLIGAILMSGAISVVVLDRTRGDAARAVGGLFDRINARIDASASAEDFDDDVSTDAERDAEDKSVGEQQDSGGLESGDQRGPVGSGEHQS
mgnify:CR=1 FL=1